MSIFFLDVSGGREWKQFHNAQDLLNSRQVPVARDLVFVHATDVLRANRHSGSGIPVGISDDRWQPLLDILKSFQQTAQIGPGQATIVFLSGVPRFLEQDQTELRELLNKHEQTKIHFATDIPHKVESSKLEEHFGEFVKTLADLAVDVAAPQAVFGVSTEDFELATAFRYLWQTYVLATTDPNQVPETLKALRLRMGQFTFGHDYWVPILGKEGRLDERLMQIREKELQDVAVALNRVANWDNPSIDEVVTIYRQRWFAAFSNVTPVK